MHTAGTKPLRMGQISKDNGKGDCVGPPTYSCGHSNVPLSTKSVGIVVGKKRQGRIFKEPKGRKIQNHADD